MKFYTLVIWKTIALSYCQNLLLEYSNASDLLSNEKFDENNVLNVDQYIFTVYDKTTSVNRI